MKKTLPVVIAMLLIAPVVRAENAVPVVQAEQVSETSARASTEDEIPPERQNIGQFTADEKIRHIMLEPGFLAVGTDKAPSLVKEYSTLESTPVARFGYDYMTQQSLHMFDFFYQGPNDFDYDLHVYYKDRLRLEIDGNYFTHNRQHQYFYPATSPTDSVLATYLPVDIRKDNLSLKLRPFDTPFHVTAGYSFYSKEGDIQKRYFGPFSAIAAEQATFDVYSKQRKVDLFTERVDVRFDGIAGGVSYDALMSAGRFNDRESNSADKLQQMPGVDFNRQELRLYSNQTGQFSWGAGIARNASEANDFNASNENILSSLLIAYAPSRDIAVRLRVSYEDMKKDNPAALSATLTNINKAVSYQASTIDAGIRINLTPSWQLRGDAKTVNKQRDTNAFGLPESSTTTTTGVTMTGPVGESRLRLGFARESNENPVYLSTPETSDTVAAGIAIPLSDHGGLDLDGQYTDARSSDTAAFVRSDERRRLTLSCWHIVGDDTTLTFVGSWDRTESRLDTRFGTGGPAFVLSGSPASATTITANADASRQFMKTLRANLGMYYQRGYGSFSMPGMAGVVPYVYSTANLGMYSLTDYYQYGANAGAAYRVTDNGTLKINVDFGEHVEQTSAPLSGSVATVMASWEQRW